MNLLRSTRRRLRNHLRFRGVLRRVDGSAAARLRVWHQLAVAHPLDLVVGEPLGRSALEGSYQGLGARIGLAADAVRVSTTFALALPGEARAAVLALVHGLRFLHEQRDALLAAFAASVPSAAAGYRRNALPAAPPEQVRAVEALFIEQLGVSKAKVFCEVRYLNEVPEHEAVLALLAAMARWASEG